MHGMHEVTGSIPVGSTGFAEAVLYLMRGGKEHKDRYWSLNARG